jgi:hypothetical protein
MSIKDPGQGSPEDTLFMIKTTPFIYTIIGLISFTEQDFISRIVI